MAGGETGSRQQRGWPEVSHSRSVTALGMLPRPLPSGQRSSPQGTFKRPEWMLSQTLLSWTKIPSQAPGKVPGADTLFHCDGEWWEDKGCHQSHPELTQQKLATARGWEVRGSRLVITSWRKRTPVRGRIGQEICELEISNLNERNVLHPTDDI